VTQPQVANWEKGKAIPPPDKLPTLAEALGRPLDYLFPRDGAPDLADLRNDAGYPQNRTGDLIGARSHIPVSNAERRIRRLDEDYVERLADAYGVTVQELLDA
jgi:transcriptional regulator with XRE-family HTH domain